MSCQPAAWKSGGRLGFTFPKLLRTGPPALRPRELSGLYLSFVQEMLLLAIEST